MIEAPGLRSKTCCQQPAAYSDSILRRADLPLSRHTRLGGARRDRTDDLLRARQALSQLSYGPSEYGGSGKIRTSDLTLIRGAL
jgi:hypothetical protein